MNRSIGLLVCAMAVLASLLHSPSFGADEPDSSDAALMKGAQARIEQHRMTDAHVTVVDATGNPVPDARVSIQQTRHAFLFGCNFFLFGHVGDQESENAYRSQFSDLFNYATLGFYWPSYERQRGEPRHAYAGEVAKWCQDHGIATKGHPLAWNFLDPRWLPDDVDQVRTLQMERITDCVSRFRGSIDIWDVVNEATHFEREAFNQRSPKLTRMWMETGRIKFVDQCFRTARAANPKATLLINDYRVDPSYAKLIGQLTETAGQQPFDVIGIQSHMHGSVWNSRKIWEVCERYSSFGVPLHFTELTVLSGQAGWERTRSGNSWPSTPEGEKRQAEDVARIYTILFSHPSVTAITWWDFSDRNAWQRQPAGFVRKDMSPKPAYETLKDLVKNQWWTRTTLSTNANGCVTFRGFLGDYVVKVQVPTSKEVEVRLTLAKDRPNRQRIVVPF